MLKRLLTGSALVVRAALVAMAVRYARRWLGMDDRR